MADKTRKNDKSPQWSEEPCLKPLELFYVNDVLLMLNFPLHLFNYIEKL